MRQYQYECHLNLLSCFTISLLLTSSMNIILERRMLDVYVIFSSTSMLYASSRCCDELLYSLLVLMHSPLMCVPVLDRTTCFSCFFCFQKVRIALQEKKSLRIRCANQYVPSLTNHERGKSILYLVKRNWY